MDLQSGYILCRWRLPQIAGPTLGPERSRVICGVSTTRKRDLPQMNHGLGMQGG